MKNIRAYAGLIEAFGLFLISLQSGQCFYNASTGRWLSRDPIGEENGMGLTGGSSTLATELPTLLKRAMQSDDVAEGNAYSFVRNHPLTSVDYLGLQESCLCGLDVTKSLNSALQEIARKYKELPFRKKWTTCSGIYSLSWPVESSKAGWAWDIVPLKNIGLGDALDRPMPFFNGSSDRCKRTVTFRGQCYYGGSVNFAMWGQINSLCSGTFTGYLGQGPIVPWSLEFALNAAMAWKISRYHTFTLEEAQAVTFTIYGYTGLLMPLTVRRGMQCQSEAIPSDAMAMESLFDWRGLMRRLDWFRPSKRRDDSCTHLGGACSCCYNMGEGCVCRVRVFSFGICVDGCFCFCMWPLHIGLSG